MDFEFEKEHLNNTIKQYQEVIEDTELSLNSLPSLYRSNPEFLDNAIFTTKIKLNNLKTNINKPYFARIDFVDEHNKEDICYIGKVGVTDYDNNIITVDWRAPISSLYYDSNVGNASYNAPDGIINGTLKIKRQYDIENGILKSFTNVDTVANDELLKPYLDVSVDNRLKNIVSSIQSEQNSIIRKDFGKNLIIQGVAGSGKTTVALHRIAYLVYNHKDNINANQYMIIGPNKFFINYISSVLPDLDVNGVYQYDFIELAKEYISENFILNDPDYKLINYINDSKDSTIDKLKYSLIYKEQLDKFMYDINFSIIPNKDFYIKNFKILTKNEIMDTYKEISSNNSFSNINSRVERCILLLSKQIELKYDNLIIKLTEFINKLSDETNNKNEISKLAKTREEIKKELMNGCRQSLKKYFTNNNLSVINLYKNFITNYDSYSDNNDITIKTKEYTLNIIKQNLIDVEDLPALMYIKYKICGSMQYSNIKQIVVDEAQDYGDFNFYILKCIFNNSYFSIYGDLAQSVYSYKSIDSWDSVQNIIFENNADILTLEKSYRTTVEIMEEANNITKMLNLNTATPVIRHGKQVNYIKSNDKINIIINEINKALENNYKSIAIISKTTNESNSIYQELFNRKINITNIDNSNTQYLGGICTIPSHLSKGLEFDVVIISDANESIFSSSNQTDMKLLYVSMTRPLHELTIIYSDNLNKALKNND